MRLVKARTLSLHEFYGDSIPPYAILSHTWGDDEVTFKDWEDRARASKKAGFAKIQGACLKALEHGLDWVWVDTNCIDKTSSAELTEAINSMFDWYARSEVCYAYLGDIPSAGVPAEDIGSSRWFTRGWTLQELVAPEHVSFYAADWSKLGSRNASLADLVSDVTGIDKDFLGGTVSAQHACIAQKMSWLAKRTTTRIEDMAYCMLGLFEINMPLLYGEGSKAFTRLQHEIIRTSNDHTIFCWTWTDSVPPSWTSLLAPSPGQFDGNRNFRPSGGDSVTDEVSIYSMTNAGLSIRLPVIYTLRSYFIVLQAAPMRQSTGVSTLSCIQVSGQRRANVLYVSRVPFPRQPVTVPARTTTHLRAEPLLIMNRHDNEAHAAVMSAWTSINEYPGQFSVVLAFDSSKILERWAISDQFSTRIGFDQFLGTVTLHVTGPPSRPKVGTALIGMSRIARDGIRHLYIFIAIKIHKARVLWFCQIFDAPQEEASTTHERLMLNYQEEMRLEKKLEHLQQQVRQVKEEQTAHFCRSLDLSVVMDAAHPLQRDRENSFLRISEGRRYHLVVRKKLRNNIQDDESSGIESIDSNVATAIPSQVKEVAIPTRGLFHLPET
jgi:hypothetical protein